MIPFQQTEAGCRVSGCQHYEIRVGDNRIGIQLHTPRIFKRLKLAIVPRFGRSVIGGYDEIVEALRVFARDGAIRSLRVEVWNEDPAERDEITRKLFLGGFRPSTRRRSYRRTIWIDLTPSEEQIFAGFHATCRRHVRAPGKRGYELSELRDARFAPRLGALIHDSFRRNGGQPPFIDWAALLLEASRPQSRVRFESVFTGSSRSPDQLVAFAVAYLHGNVAEYAHAGAARTEDNAPLLYAPTWRLMKWARSCGAAHWDFGGVPEPHNSDTLQGIRQFKELFSPEIVSVGEEWLYTPPIVWSRPSTVTRLLDRRP